MFSCCLKETKSPKIESTPQIQPKKNQVSPSKINYNIHFQQNQITSSPLNINKQFEIHIHNSQQNQIDQEPVEFRELSKQTTNLSTQKNKRSFNQSRTQSQHTHHHPSRSNQDKQKVSPIVFHNNQKSTGKESNNLKQDESFDNQQINKLIDDLLKLDEESAMQKLQTLGKSNNKLNLFLDFMQTVEDDASNNLNCNNNDKKLSSEYQETKSNNKREMTTAESQRCRGTTPRFKQESNIDFESSRNTLDQNMDNRKRSNFPGFDLPFSPQPISSPEKMFNYQTQNTIFSIKKQSNTKTVSQVQEEKQIEEIKKQQQQLIESNEEEILVTESFETS